MRLPSTDPGTFGRSHDAARLRARLNSWGTPAAAALRADTLVTAQDTGAYWTPVDARAPTLFLAVTGVGLHSLMSGCLFELHFLFQHLPDTHSPLRRPPSTEDSEFNGTHAVLLKRAISWRRLPVWPYNQNLLCTITAVHEKIVQTRSGDRSGSARRENGWSGKTLERHRRF